MAELEDVLPNPIPQIRGALAWARFNNLNPASWQIGNKYHAAFENQALIIRREYLDADAPLPELPQPTMAGLPVFVNVCMPSGMAILMGSDGKVIQVLTLEEKYGR